MGDEVLDGKKGWLMFAHIGLLFLSVLECYLSCFIA